MAIYRYGDVDGNGIVDIYDVVVTLKTVAGLVTMSNEEHIRADVNRDADISAVDARAIRQHLQGVAFIYDLVEV